MRYLPAVVALVLTFGSSALAQEFVANGNFEAPVSGASFTEISAPDSTSITSWAVTSGSVDFIGNYWVGSDGGQSVDMNGTTTGQIQQTLTLSVGQQYTLRFRYSANPDGGVGTTRFLQYDVGAGGADLTGSVSATVSNTQTTSNMEWQTFNMFFIASSSSTLLSFTSLEPTGGFGVALDEVSVLESPEPATFALFGLGLGGIGLLRHAQKRRARARKA